MARPDNKSPRTSRWSRIRIAVLLALVPGLLGLAFLHWPWTAGLEERYGLDLLFKLRGPVSPPPGVCVVAIDDASYLEYGFDRKAPWPRALHGELVQILTREGATAVAFDVLFEGAGDVAGDSRFELGLFDAGNVVLGSTVERTDDPRFREARRIEPHPPFAETAAAVAEVELPPDNDGVIRWTWLTLEGRPSLALGAYEVATGDPSFRDEQGTRLISYYGPPRTIQTVSLYQALDPEQYLPPDFFRDRIVFVGASQVAAVSVSEVKDSFPTPFSGGEVGFTYGVEIHASVTANLLDGREIRVLPPALETLLLLVLALLASLTFIYLRPVIGIVALVVLEVSAWLAAYGAFTGAELWIPVVIPGVVQLPAAYVMSLVWYYLTTVRERESIRRAFGFYLSPEMIRRIAESPDSLRLGGEEVVGTAVFTDIAGFTSVAETMTAPETASMLNEYFSETTSRIFDTGGTLIKFIGDAVFAIWGAPVSMDDHATQACRAAVSMGLAQQQLGDRPAGRLVTRIGIHTGPMLVGNLGSSQRFDYTAIGDTINLAARLESLNKTMGTRTLVSGETIDQTDGTFAVRHLGRVRVVGRAEPVTLYELLGLDGEHGEIAPEIVQQFERAVQDFSSRRFDDAAAGFREVRERCGGQDGPSDLYLKMVGQLDAEPPDDNWDGVITFATK
jgi:adenylate cyclase